MLKKILKNILWIITDKLLFILLQFFIGVKIINYYGSEIYGEYSYARTIVAFSPLLLDIINLSVVKEYYDKNFNKIVSVITTFKSLIAFGIIILNILMYPFFKDTPQLYVLILLLNIDNFLTSLTIGIENYFEFCLNSRNMTIANNIIRTISYAFQLLSIYNDGSIVLIPFIWICSNFIRVLILKHFYFQGFKAKVRYIFDWKLIVELIKRSYYLWISQIIFLIYTHIDKIMIKKILGISEVGIYSVALQLTTVLGIMIVPFQTSVYPRLLELFKKNYDEYLAEYLKFNTLITQFYIFSSILSVFFIRYFFKYVYSIEYKPAIVCYEILVIATVIKANTALQIGHTTLKKITKKTLYKAIIGVIINIILNIYLIRKYGINGAAIATTITQMVVFTIDIFIVEYREQFFIQLKSLNFFNLKLYKIKLGKRR